MTNTILIFAIAAISILQCVSNGKRLITALIYSMFLLLHELYYRFHTLYIGDIDGYPYFISAIIMGGLCTEAMANLKYTSKLTENLMNINMYFIVLNALGWIAWEAGVKYEAVYELSSSLLFVSVIVCLLNWDGVEDGNYTLGGWTGYCRFGSSKGHS